MTAADPSLRRQATTPVQRRLLAGLPGFAGTTIGLVALSGWVLTLVFHGPGDWAAIRLSAIVATVVQIAAFPAVRALTTQNLMVGWGAGSLVRLLTLIVYALLVRTVLNLPLPTALVSVTVFYFLSMVIEPLFLRP